MEYAIPGYSVLDFSGRRLFFSSSVTLTLKGTRTCRLPIAWSVPVTADSASTALRKGVFGSGLAGQVKKGHP